MDVSVRRAYDLLKSLAYQRVSCSKEEEAAASRLLALAKEIGVDAHIEPFPVACGRVDFARFSVLEPYQKTYEVTGYLRSDSTGEEGLTRDFLYVEDMLDANLYDAKDKIVLINGPVRMANYQRLKAAGVAGIVTFSGTTLDRASETDIAICKFRETLTERHGFSVGVNLRAADAAELVRRGAKKVRMDVRGERFDGESRNVCAVIPGTERPDEIISLGAHYDSVYFSTGVYDNMAGSVILTELLRYFAAHPAKRTLKFNWYGSEEQGLLGSKAWTKAHEEELKDHLLMINVDVGAATLGKNIAPVLATDEATAYVAATMREFGVACEVKSDTYSSDCIPFADHGVPAVNFARFGAPGANYIHNRRDNLKSGYIDEKSLGITLLQALRFTDRVANAAVFPIKREVSDEMKEKIEVYLFRKEKK